MDWIAQRGVAMARAIMALKLKRGSMVGNSYGTLIRQPGKPDLLLTWEAAVDFANQMDEAEHAS